MSLIHYLPLALVFVAIGVFGAVIALRLHIFSRDGAPVDAD